MSAKNAEMFNKLKALNKETAEIVSGLAKNTAADVFGPPPEIDSAPAANEPPFGAPLPEELPPEEPFPFELEPQIAQDIPQDTAAAPTENVQQPSADNSEPEQHKVESEADVAAQEPDSAAVESNDEPAAEAFAEQPSSKPQITSITAQQWSDAVAKLYPMNKALLANSTAQIKDGCLEIYSSNAVLSMSVKDDKLRELNEEISEALGAEVKIRIVSQPKQTTADSDGSAVSALLEKAKALGIDVKLK